MSHSVKNIKMLATLLTTAFTVSLLTACNGGTGNNVKPDEPDVIGISDTIQKPTSNVPEFYRSLSGLLSNEKNSHYFDKIELTVGSNVVTVDGDERITANAPEYNENRLMLPVTTIAEITGAKVTGNVDSSNGMTIKSAYGDTISCSSNSTSLSINGMESSMDAIPYSKGNDAYMSVNSIADALELEWAWNQESSTLTLTAPYQNARLVVVADSELDTSGLGAETVLDDGTGIWILQFASPSDAKAAMKMLNVKGYNVKPDYYLALDSQSKPALDFDTDTYSWGVINCGFNEFIEAHSKEFIGSATVAVVDTGVYIQHPFLNGRVLNGFDIIDGDFDPQDDVSHGTHVSGTIIDCARNAPVQILPVRVLGEDGGSDSSVIAGIKYAVSRGADVINLSLGGARYDGAGAIESAIDYAVANGCVVVISAGNSNEDTEGYDPAYVTGAGTIIVSAGDERHNKAYFSNYGESVDVMAPGVSIKSSIPGGNLFEVMDGTSMAAPHVSAAVALLDLATGKSLSPAELEAILHSATTNGKWENPQTGYGFLDLRNATIGQSEHPPKKEPEPKSNVVVEAGYYSFRNASGKSLSHYNSETNALDDSALRTWYNQWWYVQPVENHYYIMYLTETMNVSGGKYEVGNPVVIFPHSGNKPNELWQFWTEDGTSFKIVPYEHTNLAVKANESGFTLIDRADGDTWTLVQLDSVSIDGNFLNVESGYYGVMNSSGRFLSFDTPQFTLADEHVWWYVENVNGAYSIRHRSQVWQSLDLSHGTLEDGNEVIAYQHHGGTNQQWDFIRVDDDSIQITPSSDNHFVVTPRNGSIIISDEAEAGNDSFWILNREH